MYLNVGSFYNIVNVWETPFLFSFEILLKTAFLFKESIPTSDLMTDGKCLKDWNTTCTCPAPAYTVYCVLYVCVAKQMQACPFQTHGNDCFLLFSHSSIYKYLEAYDACILSHQDLFFWEVAQWPAGQACCGFFYTITSELTPGWSQLHASNLVRLQTV